MVTFDYIDTLDPHRFDPPQRTATMDTNPGMISPRKAMAMGKKPSGAEGVMKHPGEGVTHVPPMAGRASEMGDGGRGIGMTAQHGRQAAPDHGGISDHFRRGPLA